MSNVYFLDIFMFIYVLQFLFYFKESMLGVLVKKFLSVLVVVFSYDGDLPLSSVISIFTFVVLLTCCFGGYFTYSFCPCGMLEFTFVYAVVAWMSTFFTFISSEKFSVYITKEGDGFLKTFSMLLVEVVSEISRPLALTVRLTVNVLVGHMISMMIYRFLELTAGVGYVWLTVLAIMMECFVFFIQSYIFSRLIYLYLNE
uniref:F-ATPase protein 6 n=2 Tax=Contracaecum TaxID=47567 RepID=A0A1D8KW75_9BILA|nr:ATP synthase F0 subunit 6 [Contracaecum ogmorhini sensu lato South Africa]YP_009312589.1 ATP synthase F0 subunit 6 [Contracaecum ogmorhini sensu lato Pacific Canada]AOV63339.1 ATP synthase subunit 6 [Contracaecum ogmorhini sensu lato South Africa]AOV63351.1 ATP synthase subunit 6 [Contracaecum ogmorhini sensu lato Pacific Canada]